MSLRVIFHRLRRSAGHLFAVSALIVSAACGTVAAATASRQYLDDETAATVTVASDGFVFAREASDLAANTRDYVSLTPVEVNRGGRRTHVLAAYLWSTIDRSRTGGSVPSEFTLVLDDRRVALRSAASAPTELGVGKAPAPPPARGARLVFYAVDASVFDALITATTRLLRVPDESEDEEPFALWRDASSAAKEFLETVDPSRYR